MKSLNQALIAVIEKREALRQLGVNDNGYEQARAQLSEAEENFMFWHGTLIDEALMDVYDEYAPDLPVQAPLDYLPYELEVVQNGRKGGTYVCPPEDGLSVPMDDYPDKETRLAMLPNPFRIVLNIEGEGQVPVWTAEQTPSYANASF